MELVTRKLSDSIGTEIRISVDDMLRPEAAAKIRDVLVERGVLLFPELNISGEDQVRFAAMMGEVRQEGDKGLYKITIDPKENARGDYLKGSFLWHMDGTHDHTPVFASLLSGRVLSKEGGDTLFANSYAAYEALSDDMKKRIAPLKVYHSVYKSMERAGIASSPQNEANWSAMPDQTHSLVWTHASGRKSLAIGCHASHVVGMDRAESDALLDELMEWVTQPRFTYRHKWTVGDMLIWDNTGVLHRAEPYSVDSGRLMHRTTLMGEEAFS